MRKLALLLAAAAFTGCEETKAAPKETPKTANEGSGSMPRPVKDEPKQPDKPAEKPKVTRKVTDPSKKGIIATYKCGCTGNLWTQPAEEEKLCIDDCAGSMPTCGELVKEEPAAK